LFQAESVSRICRRIPVVLITKQSHGQTFRTSGAFCFLFEFGGNKKGIGGVPFSMAENYSSAGPDDGQF